jgi:FtsH-binding integral membrane protein
MKILLAISHLRRHLSKHSKTYFISIIGLIAGMIISSATIDAIANLFGMISIKNLYRLCVLLLLVVFVTIAWIVLLKNDIKRHKKYLKQYAPPNFDIDSNEEYDEAWNEATRDDKK